ncbi:MAG TPA: hypothetical protein VGE07_27220 [Herpetosiphonaceae bacterium]
MKRAGCAALLIVLLAIAGLGRSSVAAAAPSDLDLAYRWAPVHFQDTDSSDYDADYITAVDYDGDWDAKNNWERQDDNGAALKAKAYFSIVETATHWHIVYSFYHPRDWEDFLAGTDAEHENDLEGALVVVRKDGSAFGAFEGMVTVAHSDFFSWTPPGSPWRSGRESIDGAVVMRSFDGVSRPTTFQEAKGHGLKAWNGGGFPGGDGVIYEPSLTVAEVPSGGNDSSARYQLIDVFAAGGLWAHRSDPLTFASWGVFRGDNGKDNAANAPWKWDDKDDGGALPGGELATDPAKLINIYFSNLGAFSLTYARNGYR